MRLRASPRSSLGREPDYRFTLANERTFLAYVRTALALDAAGLAVKQFLDPGTEILRITLAVALVTLGGCLAALGYMRWQQTETAMRLERSLPPGRMLLPLALGLVGVSAIGLLVVLTSH